MESEITCNKCLKRPAQVRLEYGPSDYCAVCFCDLFEKRVAKANREFHLLKRGDKIAVGVSGGKDSAAVLYVLNKMAKRIGDIKIVPICIDEGIKSYRDKAIKKAKELCKKLGLKLHVFNYKELFSTTMDYVTARRAYVKDWKGACSYCGVFRKYALNLASRKLGCNKLAVGHNADDIAQTVFMNFVRNEPKRMRRFGVTTEDFQQALFVTRIKPLVYCLERECALYCALRELPFHLQECPYSNESFRGEVKDFLNAVEAKHPGSKFNIIRSFLSLQKELKKTDSPNLPSSTKQPGKCQECGEYTSMKTCKACQLKKEVSTVFASRKKKKKVKL